TAAIGCFQSRAARRSGTRKPRDLPQLCRVFAAVWHLTRRTTPCYPPSARPALHYGSPPREFGFALNHHAFSHFDLLRARRVLRDERFRASDSRQGNRAERE